MAAAADIYAQTVRAMETGHIVRRVEPLKGSTAVGKGWMTVIDAGYVKAPAAAIRATAKSNGVSLDNVDNSAGADGDLTVPTEDGVIDCLNSGTNACTAADVGLDVYAEDHQTIGNLSTAGCKIGTLEAFAPLGGMPGRPCRVRLIMSR